MNHFEKIIGAWVEIQERGDAQRIVLLRPDADVPPSRGGRRKLEIDDQGAAWSLSQGASDRMEANAQGDWALDNDQLKLKLEGWEGDYTVETMTETELILNRR